MHLVLVNCLAGLSLPRNRNVVVRLSDLLDMANASYRGSLKKQHAVKGKEINLTF